MIGSASLGPFAFVAIDTSTGPAWVRIDQVAAITTYEVILLGTPGVILKLADDETPQDVLHAMRHAVETVGLGGAR